MTNTITLVTTELEETWPDEGKVLFLGEWCRLYSRKEKWSGLDAEVLPYHWDDRGKLQADFKYLQDFNHILLKGLVPILNELHSVDFDEKYWHLLLGYWLNLYTAVLFDRWSSIKLATASYSKLETLIQFDSEGILASNDTNNFLELSIDDANWNHAVFGILARKKPSSIMVKTLEKCLDKAERKAKKPRSASSLIKQIVSRAANLIWFFKGNDKFVFIKTYLPLKKQCLLDIKFNQLPTLSHHFPETTDISFDSSYREWLFPGASTEDEFQTIAKELLPKFLPRIFLEGYLDAKKMVNKLAMPKSPLIIWTSVSHFSDIFFQIWAAEKIAQGSKLIVGEHGGLGVGLYNGAHEYELFVADKYFSTGWKDSSNSKIIPIGNFRHFSKQRSSYNLSGGQALLVCGNTPRYSFDIRSMALSSQFLSYFEDQFRFIHSLSENMRNNILVRLYRSDYHWDQKGRWKDSFPEINFDDGNKEIWKVMKGCRLFISSYNATTYIESMSRNIPTVMYWNKNYWEVTDSAKPFFDTFEDLGIFHSNPESAAKHIEKIWDEVNNWWFSSKVQAARESFLQAYASNPPDMLAHIERVIRETADSNNIVK